jgi:hypothetical protein
VQHPSASRQVPSYPRMPVAATAATTAIIMVVSFRLVSATSLLGEGGRQDNADDGDGHGDGGLPGRDLLDHQGGGHG